MNTKKIILLFGVCSALFLFSCSDLLEEELNDSAEEQLVDTRALSVDDMYLWKITFPFNSSGQLSGNTDAAESKEIEEWLDDNPDNDYFYNNSGDTKVYFIAPHNGAVTSNPSGPRCELREREEKPGGGTIDAEWRGDQSTSSHFLWIKGKVLELPNTDRVTFAQVHDVDSTLDDVIQIGIKPNPNDGNDLYVTLQGSILTGPDESANYDYLFPYSLGDFFDLKIKVKNNVVTVKRNNGGWSDVFTKSIKDKWPGEDLDGEYFKAGVYLQGGATSGEGKVLLSKAKVTHYD